MRKRIIIWTSIMLVLAVGLGILSITGFQIGKYVMDPLPRQVDMGLDLTGGVSIVYRAVDTSIEDFGEKMDGARLVFENRLVALGFTEATVTRQGGDKIRCEIPINENSQITDPQEVTDIVGQPAKLEFYGPENDLIMEGKNIVSSKPMMQENEYVVSFQLDAEGTTAFAEATQKYLQQTISIVLDGTTISAPTVQSVIPNGEGTISGDFTAESVRTLALQIESGALPLEMEEAEVRAISATLGETALQTGLFAGMIGVLLVFLFMIIFYRFPGLMADIALLIYMVLMLYALVLVPGVQLTLPGVAGIILSVGMAVDANVVIFERLKEEYRTGQTLRASLRSGFSKAFRAILDANVTSLIAVVVLLMFGSGPIRGFAATLGIGIVLSMFTALFVTKNLMRMAIELDINKPGLYVPKRRALS